MAEGAAMTTATMTTSSEPSGSEVPDPQRAAEEVLGNLGATTEPETEGKPEKKARKKPHWTQTPEGKEHLRRLNRQRAAKKKGGRVKDDFEAELEGPPEPEITPEAYAFLGSTLWNLAGPALHVRPLTEEESLQLGRALAPVADKYLPALRGWQEEATLGLVLVDLWQKTRTKKGGKDAAATVAEAEPVGNGSMVV